MVKLKLCSSGEYEVLFHYHYSQVHSELSWENMLSSIRKLFVLDWNTKNCVQQMIIIESKSLLETVQ